MSESRLDLSEIQSAIQYSNARWQPGETSMSRLPREEQRKRLGAVPPTGELTLEQIEQIAAVRLGQPPEPAPGAPAAFDWRNVSGGNYVTPVKNQGSCGSCVAFGTCAAIETTYRVQVKNPSAAVDLSEAHLFYCHGRSQGRTCDNGWWPDRALQMCQDTGVTDEACYPYTPGDQNCTGRCNDWEKRVMKITGYQKLTSTADMKTWLATKGALTACFIVYEDFYSYRSGVYTHVTGQQLGGHCVTMIGYDDQQSCWICKNSWGSDWGENGFFRIAYGAAGIDTWQVCGVAGIVLSEDDKWLQNKKVTGLWAIAQERNAWVYLDGGTGWRRIDATSDVIFVTLLAQLTSAKAANRPVNLYVDGGLIRQVYVL